MSLQQILQQFPSAVNQEVSYKELWGTGGVYYLSHSLRFTWDFKKL